MGRQLIPRGVEVLVKKAAVDADFRQMLLDKRSAAAAQIGLRLTPAEMRMLDSVPRPQLLAIIESTCVTPAQRTALLGKVAAAMLAALGMAPNARGTQPGFAEPVTLPVQSYPTVYSGTGLPIADLVFRGTFVTPGPEFHRFPMPKTLPPMVAEIVLGWHAAELPRTESGDVILQEPEPPPAPMDSLSPWQRAIVSPPSPPAQVSMVLTIGCGSTPPQPDRERPPEPPPPKLPPVAPEPNPAPYISMDPDLKPAFPPPELLKDPMAYMPEWIGHRTFMPGTFGMEPGMPLLPPAVLFRPPDIPGVTSPFPSRVPYEPAEFERQPVAIGGVLARPEFIRISTGSPLISLSPEVKPVAPDIPDAMEFPPHRVRVGVIAPDVQLVGPRTQSRLSAETKDQAPAQEPLTTDLTKPPGAKPPATTQELLNLLPHVPGGKPIIVLIDNRGTMALDGPTTRSRFETVRDALLKVSTMPSGEQVIILTDGAANDAVDLRATTRSHDLRVYQNGLTTMPAQEERP